jgi:hypothetical protein
VIREAAAKVKGDQAAQNKKDGLGGKTKRVRDLEEQKRLRELKEQKNEKTRKWVAKAIPRGESDDFSDSDDDSAEDKATGAAPPHSPSPLLSP